MRIAVGILMAALVAACSGTPKTVAGTPDHVTIRLKGNAIQSATQEASNYCGALGKVARLENVAQDGNGELATFNCL